MFSRKSVNTLGDSGPSPEELAGRPKSEGDSSPWNLHLSAAILG